MNYVSTALRTGDYVGLTYIAQSLIVGWHTFNNESKHDACDSIRCGRVKISILQSGCVHSW